jgi:integrase
MVPKTPDSRKCREPGLFSHFRMALIAAAALPSSLRNKWARFKTPKSRAGRRDITLPGILVAVLREHRKAQLELRVRLGAGRLHDNDLLLADIDGNPISPTAFSTRWGEFAERIGMPGLTFHALRHTHASQLIDAGVDIVTIAKRLGHAKPDITLRTYGFPPPWAALCLP